MANIEGAAPKDPATIRFLRKFDEAQKKLDPAKVEQRDALASKLASQALAPPAGAPESRPVQEMKAKLDTGMTEEMKAVFSTAMGPYQSGVSGLAGRVSTTPPAA